MTTFETIWSEQTFADLMRVASSGVSVAGTAVVAKDTGRILMIQRSTMDKKDPAAGTWEFPGGHIDPGEDPFTGAKREFEEEVGHTFPEGHVAGNWLSPNGIYQGFVVVIDKESDLDLNLKNSDRHVTNPDDPKGKYPEVACWWEIEDAKKNPALRKECKDSDWKLMKQQVSKKAVKNPPKDLTITHEEDPAGIKYKNNKLRAHLGDKMVGYLEYASDGRDDKATETRVRMLNVHKDHRRQGIASALMDHMQAKHPNASVHHGGRTPEGKAWWDGYTQGQDVKRGRTAVKEPPEGLEFTHQSSDYGGTKWSEAHKINAHIKGNNVGELTYLMNSRGTKANINFLRVHEDHRRKGIGSALMDEMQRRHPRASIDHGDRTNDGKAWWKGYSDGKDINKGRTALLRLAEEYWMSHRPNSPESGAAAPAHALDQVYPADVYTHPHYYDVGSGNGGEKEFSENVKTLRSIRGKPEAKVTMYRSLPPEHAHKGFQTGDWTSLHPSYAQGHGMHNDDPKKDWPVIKATVPAKHLWNSGDSLDEFGYHGPPIKGEIHSPGGSESARILKQHKAVILNDHDYEKSDVGQHEFLPHERIFSPGKTTLDFRLFKGDKMKPEVRNWIINRLDPILSKYNRWKEWTRIYLAGSEATYFYGNNDLDILLGINSERFRQLNPTWADKTDEEIDTAITDVMKKEYDDEDATVPWDNQVWHLTSYANPHSWDIRDIKPYGAYELLSNQWYVRPPEVPKDWGPEYLGKSVWDHFDAVKALVRSIETLPEPDRTREGAALWDMLHEDRQRAFSNRGYGWTDPGNIIFKGLDMDPTDPLKFLLECKHREEQAQQLIQAKTPEAKEPKMATMTLRELIAEVSEQSPEVMRIEAIIASKRCANALHAKLVQLTEVDELQAV